MYYAIDVKSYERVDCYETYIGCNSTEGEYICPMCRHKVIPCRGDINTWHFRHYSTDNYDRDCDEWYKQDEWVYGRMKLFPEDNREVTVFNGKGSHRAHVYINGTVVIFQPNSISGAMFRDRTAFFSSDRRKLIWVINVEGKDITKRRSANGNLYYRWRHPYRMDIDDISDYVLFLDTGSRMIKVTWVSEDSGLSYFFGDDYTREDFVTYVNHVSQSSKPITLRGKIEASLDRRRYVDTRSEREKAIDMF